MNGFSCVVADCWCFVSFKFQKVYSDFQGLVEIELITHDAWLETYLLSIKFSCNNYLLVLFRLRVVPTSGVGRYWLHCYLGKNDVKRMQWFFVKYFTYFIPKGYCMGRIHFSKALAPRPHPRGEDSWILGWETSQWVCPPHPPPPLSIRRLDQPVSKWSQVSHFQLCTSVAQILPSNL